MTEYFFVMILLYVIWVLLAPAWYWFSADSGGSSSWSYREAEREQEYRDLFKKFTPFDLAVKQEIDRIARRPRCPTSKQMNALTNYLIETKPKKKGNNASKQA